jgi:nitrilase
MPSNSSSALRVAIAQIAPVWLDREATAGKVAGWVRQAATAGAQLVAFGEALLPGYPFWVEHTGGARFDDPVQKDLYAHYCDQAVQIERGDLDAVRGAALEGGIWVALGTIERAPDRGGHSLYCTLVLIDDLGQVRNAHRKLVPTHEERLVWAPGDGEGLRTFEVGEFTLGALNCWENWMPLARAALSAQGEDLHVAIWPGSPRNTEDITRFVAKEGRSYVLSASGLMRREHIGDHIPHADLLRERLPVVCASGGSAIAGPDGNWVVEPVDAREQLLVADLDRARVFGARQNFDPVGHYARPDVLGLTLKGGRRGVLTRED